MNTIASLLLTLVAMPPEVVATNKPNVVIILADDMGYSDLGCYGSEIPTPNLDALAQGGMRLRSFYNCAQCCPTRASLISGMYSHQAGVGDMIDGHSLAVRTAAASPRYSDRLDPRALTLAERLRPAGYQTYMTGKWHLGYHEGQRPLQRGFDRYFGIIAGADSYWKPKTLYEGDTHVPPDALPADFYATEAFTTKAIEFIEQGDATRPFLLYVAYNAVHTPFHAPESEIAKHRGRYDEGWDVIRQRRFARQKQLGLWPADTQLPPRDPTSQPWTGSPEQLKMARRMEIYAAMLTKMDENVGRLVAALKRRGQLDNTLILFLSDNGAWAISISYGQEWAETCDTPFRFFKLFAHEGGICTPLIAHWPKRIPAGTLNTKQYAHVKDILPTCLAAAGIDVAGPADALPVTGRSFLRALVDPAHADNETLFWERMGNSAVRQGDWKLVRCYNQTRTTDVCFGPRTGRWDLFNLAEDPTETRDLAASHSERRDRMLAAYEAWERQVGVVPREVIVERIKSRGLTNAK
jgi:arylsulfatase